MCPTVVLRGGKPILAVGAHGGRRIPNSVFTVLMHYVGRDASIADAVAAPRLHTEGDLEVTVEASWPQSDVAAFQKVGYTVKRGPAATIHAIDITPSSGAGRTASR